MCVHTFVVVFGMMAVRVVAVICRDQGVRRGVFGIQFLRHAQFHALTCREERRRFLLSRRDLIFGCFVVLTGDLNDGIE
jgi:hypothetical protein